MNNIRENKYYKLAMILIKLSLLVFVIYTVVQFFHTISQTTLYIFLGIILTWRIWKFFLKLIWLLVQIGIFCYVIYLLIY